jgi:hypothetical protein
LLETIKFVRRSDSLIPDSVIAEIGLLRREHATLLY